MKEFIEKLDHLCSVKEYSSYGGFPVLRDSHCAFRRVFNVESETSSDVVIKLPLLKHHKIDPRQIFYEIEDEIKRKYYASTCYDLGFDKIIQELLEVQNSSTIIQPLYLSMPHNPNQDFYEDCGYLSTIMFNGKDTLAFNLSQIDVDIYSALPYNLMYCTLFAGILANMVGRRLSAFTVDFLNPYIRKEDLPRIAKVLEEEFEFDTCVIKFNKKVNDLDDLKWEDFLIEIY